MAFQKKPDIQLFAFAVNRCVLFPVPPRKSNLTYGAKETRQLSVLSLCRYCSDSVSQQVRKVTTELHWYSVRQEKNQSFSSLQCSKQSCGVFLQDIDFKCQFSKFQRVKTIISDPVMLYFKTKCEALLKGIFHFIIVYSLKCVHRCLSGFNLISNLVELTKYVIFLATKELSGLAVQILPSITFGFHVCGAFTERLTKEWLPLKCLNCWALVMWKMTNR